MSSPEGVSAGMISGSRMVNPVKVTGWSLISTVTLYSPICNGSTILQTIMELFHARYFAGIRSQQDLSQQVTKPCPGYGELGANSAFIRGDSSYVNGIW